MDQRRIELQIRLILLTYRREHRRQDSPTMVAFRQRALQSLTELDADAREYPELHQLALAARSELSSDGVTEG